MIAGCLLVAVPALVLGVRRVNRHGGRVLRPTGADRREYALIVVGRVLGLLFLLALTLLVLLAAVGGLVRDREVPDLVSVFFVLALLLSALVVLTSGGGGPRRRSRRRGTPARR
ncbi:MAG: rane protein of unknown function [Klenkia sp.]|nr:rane protein of unknown function [Klenkia sp.]